MKEWSEGEKSKLRGGEENEWKVEGLKNREKWKTEKRVEGKRREEERMSRKVERLKRRGK